MAATEGAKDLLFEIGTEELPSWYVSQGAESLAALLRERLAAAGLPATSTVSFGTPRRLAVIAREVPAASAIKTEERRGPSAAVAFDAEGRATRAAVAFADGAGVRVEDLERRQTDKGEYVYARRQTGGEAAGTMLPDLLASLVADLPAPRKMRWADEPTAFIRPVAWLLALHGGVVIDVKAAGLRSAGTTSGHRFLAPEAVAVREPAAYQDALRAAWVLADGAERRDATLAACEALAAAEGLALARQAGQPEPELVGDGPAGAERAERPTASPTQGDELLDEVAGLIEWPFPILGSFDPSYLELPDEVLTTVMIKHQRFFPTRSPDGKLAPRFIGVSNNRVADEDVVRRGYEGVLDGRLYDAGFFWRSDRRKTLAQHAWSLSGIAFQRDLGSMADKSARVATAADAMAAAVRLSAADRDVIARALPLFRADLATEMVYEFPELEGVMARAYALAEGLPRDVADALAGGVMPKGPTDPLPPSGAGALLAVADRLDKLAGFFALDKRPSGSADPFGLRRDALALVRVTCQRGWRVALETFVEAAASAYREGDLEVGSSVQAAVLDFLWDRVASLLHEHGFATNVGRAAIGGSATVLGAIRRAVLLRTLLDRGEFADLSALFKRAANLAEKRGATPGGRGPVDDGTAGAAATVDPELFEAPQEAPLYAALETGAAGVGELLAAVADQLPPFDPVRAPEIELAGLDAALARVLSLKAPLDEFLDDVLVMAPDERLRSNRLALLAAVVEPLRRLGALEHLAR
ncbi:MAG TPA: glycine--tRNA ligase subunit beta [Trueperaceae bacterium]|nr:glycine--tRNA ligase subunit beta [Trueperaceae bacterium]